MGQTAQRFIPGDEAIGALVPAIRAVDQVLRHVFQCDRQLFGAQDVLGKEQLCEVGAVLFDLELEVQDLPCVEVAGVLEEVEQWVGGYTAAITARNQDAILDVEREQLVAALDP